MLSRFLTPREQFILVFFGASILIGALVLLYEGKRVEAPTTPDALEPVPAQTPPAAPAPPEPVPSPAPPQSAATTSAPAAAQSEREIAAGIRGAVRRPGLYRLPAGSRLGHLLAAAGGALPEADLEAIDLAAPLRDSVTYQVPRKKAISSRRLE